MNIGLGLNSLMNMGIWLPAYSRVGAEKSLTQVQVSVFTSITRGVGRGWPFFIVALRSWLRCFGLRWWHCVCVWLWGGHFRMYPAGTATHVGGAAY